jgi:hypothetical protein
VLALASVDSFRVADRLYLLTGGRGIDSAALAALATDGVTSRLLLPGDSKPAAEAIAGSIRFPFVDLSRGDGASAPDSAEVVILRDLGPLIELRKSVDRWFLFALVITVVTALLIAAWLSARMSRPWRSWPRRPRRWIWTGWTRISRPTGKTRWAPWPGCSTP